MTDRPDDATFAGAAALDAAPGQSTGPAPAGGPGKGLFIRTYGCQMNVYDSERMRDVLAPLGYRMADSPEQAELVVLNTCHIREKATEKVYSELGQLKRMKEAGGGRMRIAVAGCVAQAEGAEIQRRQPAVDIVVGPQSYHRLPELIARVARGVGDPLEVDFAAEEKFDALPKTRNPNGKSAFLSVQEGCDKFCTFCVVPYTRGAEYSRGADEIVAEARQLVREGVREIVLIGQNVNAWRGKAPAGAAAAADGCWSLADLIRHIATIGAPGGDRTAGPAHTRDRGLESIRYTTSHPRDMSDDLIAVHAEVEALAPYLHLPVQSGSDRILRAMNRGHSAADYLRIVDKMRAAKPGIAIASDFIVGFPGETDRDFEDTLKLVRDVNFAAAYSFKYSARPGTPAAALPGQIDEAVKDERLARLMAELGRLTQAFNDAQIGRTLRVLFDRPGRRAGQGHGYSPFLQAVHVDGASDLIGLFADVRITGATQNSLTGVIVGDPIRGATSAMNLPAEAGA